MREGSLTDLLAEVEAGNVDAVVAAVTVTAAREARMDFSHPFYSAGLGVAVRKQNRGANFVAMLGKIIWPLLSIIGGLIVLSVLAGVIIWLAERRRNPEHCDTKLLQGIDDGIWWAVVTMTTVGYLPSIVQ